MQFPAVSTTSCSAAIAIATQAVPFVAVTKERKENAFNAGHSCVTDEESKRLVQKRYRIILDGRILFSLRIIRREMTLSGKGYDHPFVKSEPSSFS